MRKIPLLLVLLSYFTASAQHPLSQGRRSSVYDYLYELNYEETLRIYTYGIHKVNNSFLHNLKDSFPHDRGIPEHIPPGNYLRVYAENDKLQTVFTSIPNLYIKQLNNARDLVVILHDEKGNLIKNADVRIGRHVLQYDKEANAYLLEKYKRSGVLEVYQSGVLNCFRLSKPNKVKKRSFWHAVNNTFNPAAWRHKGSSKSHYQHRSYSGFITTAYEKRHVGYMVTNKPKYKPGDTIKLKAFITDKKGKPVNTPLLLRISNNYYDIDTILTTLNPYSPGAYSYEFVCSPELDLDLDENYSLTLETTDSRKYDLDTYDGDLEDEEYAAKRKVLIRTDFKFEEYELRSLEFTARTDKGNHSSGEKVAIYCQAKDENDLAVMDGHIALVITSGDVEKYYEKDMFIPDTLWQYSGQMDAIGETKIMVPENIFPKADLKYGIECIFTNSNNERHTSVLKQEYHYGKGSYAFTVREDSLYITSGGVSTAKQHTNVYGVNSSNDTIETFSIVPPAAIKINSFISTYKLKSDNATGAYTFSRADGNLDYDISWNNDTTTIKVKNPKKLFFWYSIFERGKVIERGYANTLTWRGATLNKKQYELRTSYIWQGNVKEGSIFFADPGNPLDISLITPLDVYPGQTTQVTVNVKDKYLKPVADADLTAYAYTSKFKEEPDPLVPSFQPRLQKRKQYQIATYEHLTNRQKALELDWEKHKRKMGLDSLLFFQFTHPAPFFTYAEPAPDTITQIAPFVFSRGSIHPVHILSVDELPVYCSLADPLQPYSVKVTPGKHKISLRTLHQRISFNITVPAGVKTFISIDSAIGRPDVQVEKMPIGLTLSEQWQVNRYMLRVRNTFGNHPVYIKQHEQIYWLDKTGNSYNNPPEYIVGPITGRNAFLIADNVFAQYFDPEPGYSFEISKGLIKQKQISDLSKSYRYLSLFETDTSLSSMAWSQNMADSLLHLLRLHKLRENDLLTEKYVPHTNTRLVIDLDRSGISPTSDVLQFLFFRYDDPSFVRSYKGSAKHFNSIDTGYYKLLILLDGRRYFIKDSISIKKDSLHYYSFDNIDILPEDSVSIELDEKLQQIAGDNLIAEPDRRVAIAETFNRREFSTANLTREIYGLIVDERGEPVPGATVILRGTRSGCATNAKGRFQLPVTAKGFLMVASVGYETVEQRLNDNDFYKITLTANVSHLNETVVVGYATTTKRYNTGTVSYMKMEEIQQLFTPQIRGANSLANDTSPLVIINGVPFIGKLSDLSSEDIKNITVLKDAEATAIYGSRGANGVVIITTKRQGENGQNDLQQLPGVSGLRTNFRDDAFWQPRLRTDANGNASFKVTFPDDITSWNAYAIAMTDKKQAGMRKIQIRSFKTLSGNLGLPTFAVEGDAIHVISKALNYTPDSIRATHTFSMNDSMYFSNTIAFKNAFIDTTPVFIKGTDSISFKYTVNKEGYMDGEQRKIPLVERGTEETTGLFAALLNDTSLSYTPERPESIMIRAESAVLPVLLDEMVQVQRYRYLCNEQLASKLKAYLLEKKVSDHLKKDFKKDKDIKDILNRLDQQKRNGLWGWWENSPVSVWISRHVIEALLMAEEQGYKTSYNKQVAIDHFVYELNSGKERDSIGCMQLLAGLGAKINYASYIDSIIARSGKSGYDTIGLAFLQRKVGIPLDLSPILSRERTTVFGNAYWGRESYDLFDNSIQKTLQVYKLLRQTGGYETLLQKMRGYFLEQRKDGRWRNTYESSLILETILPDVLEDESQGPAALDINDRHITRFPYTDTLTRVAKINISKQGKRPVYFTAYQQFFNRQPEKISGLFTVSSVLSANGTVQKDLKAGVPATLKVEVTVQKTADYVLIEIPIPAGCSYNDKSQSWASNEVHREHFKDRVSIFCSQLRPGKHTFNVSLLPRYSGSYHLNPAKAEMQYFPVFMGREALKKVNIH